MSYPKNADTPKAVTVGSVILIADGTVQTSDCSVRVSLDGGVWGAGDGTLAYDATSGVVTYAPTQAETNGAVLKIAVYKALCIGCSTTVLMDLQTGDAYALGVAGVHISVGTAAGQINVSGGVVPASGNWNVGKTGYTLTTQNWNVGKDGYALASTGLNQISTWNVTIQAVNVCGSLSGTVTVGSFGTAQLGAANFGDGALNGKGDWNTTTPPTASAIKTAIEAAGSSLATIITSVGVIQAKTDTIGTVEMTAVSPTIVDDTFTIYAGDDYADADGRALTVTGVDASDFDLEASGVEVVFRLLKWTDYRQDDTTEAELEATATVDEVDGDGLATLSVELTADQTGALATSPPQPEKNYAFQWIATLESGRTVLLASGRMTVVKRLTDAS